jgi:hypothetical protein
VERQRRPKTERKLVYGNSRHPISRLHSARCPCCASLFRCRVAGCVQLRAASTAKRHYYFSARTDLGSADGDCPQNGNSQFGTATCTGPPIPGSAKSCIQSCNADADCQALGEAHGSDRCVANVCEHTPDPEALVPGAIQAVVDRFAAHGITLHVVRGQALPHSHVLTFRALDQMTDGCEGGSLDSGTAGLGLYAESYLDLKTNYFDPKKNVAYHYTIFSHYSGCDTEAHCRTDAHTGACPLSSTGCPTVAYSQSGYSEINGNDFIVSLGSFINDKEAFLTTPAPGGAPEGQFIIGGIFMHELGHNLGLRHGGGVSVTPDPNTCYPPDCEDECTVPSEPNYKPNFLSVMNYRYQFTGIQNASAPGGFIPVDTRLDYSSQILPTVPVSDGVSGVLDETNLDETPAYGLTSGNADLFTFTDGTCASHCAWPAQGPVDWDGDSVAGDNSAAIADLNPQSHGAVCASPIEQHRGHVDWGPAPRQSIFRYAFQCTSFFANGATMPPLEAISSNEMTVDEATRAHVLYPTRPIHIEITPGRADKTIVPGQHGDFSIALLGSDDFKVTDVESSSLHFHGATPVRVDIRDINGDGKLDLLVTFDMAAVKLDPKAKKADLTGWLRTVKH